MPVTKTMLNKVYRGGRLLYATYHGDIWTTNTYIAERGKIEPRVYKDTDDWRNDFDKRPRMESIIDNPVAVEPVIVATINENGDTIRVKTKNYAYNYNRLYFEYLETKYGADNLLLEPLGRTSRLFASDNDGVVMAVLMGLGS